MTTIVGCIHQMLVLPYSLYAKNFPICMAILILMTATVLQKQSVGVFSKVICCAVNVITMIGFVVYYFTQRAGLIVSVALFVIVSIELIVVLKGEKGRLGRMLFLWFSPVCIILPLVFTNELGARLFFTTDAVLILFAISLLRFSLTSTGKKVCCAAVVCALACALMVQYGTVYYAIGECTRHRAQNIEKAIETGADTIYLPEYPYQEYLWNPNPSGAKREGYFKEFYDIPQEVSLVLEE